MELDDERPSQRLRSRLGPIDPSTPEEAAELARWLRQLTEGLTVRDLEGRFDYGRNQWSEFLRGRKLIPLWLLQELVAELVPKSAQRLQLGIGSHLLDTAQRAAARERPQGPAQPSGRTVTASGGTAPPLSADGTDDVPAAGAAVPAPAPAADGGPLGRPAADGADGTDTPATGDDRGPRPAADTADTADTAGGRSLPVRWQRALWAGLVSLSLLAGGALIVEDWQDRKEPNGAGAQTGPVPKARIEATQPPRVSHVLEEAKRKGVFRVGVKQDQPGLSEQDARGEWTGFDIEYARKVVRGLGFTDTIEFVPLGTGVRASEVVAGNVELFVGSFSITDDREKLIKFAGPYFATPQALLMHGDSPGKVVLRENGGRTHEDVDSIDDLRPRTVVCTASSSTSVDRLERAYPEKKFKVIKRSDYQKCVDDLLDPNGETEVVSTDRAVLAGFLATDDRLRMIRDSLPDSTEYWGIGMHLDDPELHRRVCKLVEAVKADGWQELYDAHLKGPLDGKDNRPPKPDRCRPVPTTGPSGGP
ncbi:transporter substrate-binding domain-containing protein [Streptomyces sp. NPDC058171]